MKKFYLYSFSINTLKNFTLFIIANLFFSCTTNQPLFTLLDPNTSGVIFNNHLSISDSLNIMNYIYLYNGGGVATGDINNDGLADIYFTGNQGFNKLFLNKGDLRFEDITTTAGVTGMGNWKTGVTLADVNGDGWLDIYVCAVGGFNSLQGRNQLYINNKNLTFTESAAEYGLDESGFNTQAVFFDYDRDGDLDMYLIKHSIHSSEKFMDTSLRHIPDQTSGDKLFRNEISNEKKRFTDVTGEAGIYSGGRLGFGLNAIVNDFNNDGWPDIYVSNDFNEEDYYYLNNGNGSFSELNKEVFGHESHFSMGSDAADINNDGWPDIVTLDMLAEDEKVLKSSIADDPLEIYKYKLGFGYKKQCSRNCLQLNVSAGKRFSDIGLFSGIAATDWSWSPLLADFDNDGICDLFVTNGIYRRPNDLDFMNYYAHVPEAYDLSKQQLSQQAFDLMPEGRASNYLFKGSSSLHFTNDGQLQGFDKKSFSNGAAYADLDNDGDLDLVVNNLDGLADIYCNNTKGKESNYLSIHLEGNSYNKFGLGARIVLTAGNKKFYRYQTATRGFESCSAGDIHIGLGNIGMIDTVKITWPGNPATQQELYQVKVNMKIVLRQDGARLKKDSVFSSPTLFSDVTREIRIEFQHREDAFNDFTIQPLIPHGVSTEGPKLAVGDVNADGLDDLFICGAAGQQGSLFIQTASGTFIQTNEKLMAADSLNEDVNALFFDADNDKDLDLYVVSGGNQFEGNNARLYDRLYINDGKGSFTKSKNLPYYAGNKSVAVAADIDHDGDMDLFVGGRVIAGRYGETPLSWLLINDGSGK
ncbi:MAG: VCBS repeat-containing protein, partial [Chitinophagaceae bacterium]